MSYEIHADYKQSFLLPPSLEDWVPSNHPARFIRAFVDEQNLDALGFKPRKSHIGAPNYSANLLVKICLFGYFHKIRAFRKLEHACYNDIGMIWLTGNKKPDHNTLNRFFSKNRAAFGELFKQSTRYGIRMNLIDMVLTAIDGTRILSEVNRFKLIRRKDLNQLIKEIDSDTIEEILNDIESQSAGDDIPEYTLPAELSDPKKLRDEIRKQKLLDDAGVDYIHPTDPDARMMKTRKGVLLGFNAQVAVDSKSGLLLANDVTQDAADSHQLSKMVKKMIETTGEKPVEVLADKGYFSGEEIAKVEAMGVDCLVNVQKPPNFDSRLRDGFVYDETTDTYICKHGGVLSHKYLRRKKHSQHKLYYCETYKDCPFKSECSPKSRKCLSVSTRREVVDKQVEKQKAPENRQKLARRKAIVENVFGYAKSVMKLQHWEFRGLENVRAQWNLICTAINLNKIYRLCQN